MVVNNSGKGSSEPMRSPLKTRRAVYLFAFTILFIFTLFCGGRFIGYAGRTVEVESISIELKEDKLIVGKQYKIKTSILPKNATNKRLRWISSDESIATVENDTIKPLLPGTVMITALAEDGSGISDVVLIQIIQPVIKIELSAKSVTMAPGTTWKLNAVIEPYNASNKTVNWKSTNEKVVSVKSDGTVKALKKGKANIVAKAADESKIKGTVSITVDDFDVVFTENKAQEIDTDSLRDLSIKIDVKNNHVKAKVAEGPPRKLVITPINAGQDIITVHSDNRSFSYSIYVAQTAESIPAEDLAETAKAEDNTSALSLPAATEEAANSLTTEDRLAAAREKYSAKTVNIYVQGKGKVKKGKINVCFYFSKKKQPIRISIRESLQISDPYEMRAVLEVITENENYDEATYGSLSFMKAQWITHNIAHTMASGENQQHQKWVEAVTGKKLSSVIKSAKVLDISPIELITEQEMKIIQLVEKVYGD